MGRLHTYPKRYSQIQVAAGTDSVMFGFALPAGAIVHKVWGEVNTMIPDISVLSTTVHAMHGYIIPVLDLDAGLGWDGTWDNQVPKDSPDDTEADIDIDRHTADDTPIVEIGDIHVDTIFDIDNMIRKIFKRETLGSFPKTPVAFQAGTPDTYSSVEHYKIRLNKKYRVKSPSLMLFGIGVADGLDTSTGNFTVNTAAEWAQLKYMTIALEDAMKAQLGISQTAGDDPYNQAMILLHSYLEQAFEMTAGGFAAAAALTGWGKMTAHISVPGDFGRIALTGSA